VPSASSPLPATSSDPRLNLGASGQPRGGNHPFRPVHVYEGFMYVPRFGVGDAKARHLPRPRAISTLATVSVQPFPLIVIVSCPRAEKIARGLAPRARRAAGSTDRR
jgi:hypothetical protein